MFRRKSGIWFTSASAVTVLFVALVGAACGSGHSAASRSAAIPQRSTGRAAIVGLANRDLGEVLVDSQGRTLYLFDKDRGTTSSCTGGCAAAWPPLRAAGQPSAANGTDGALLGTTTRSDGGPQVTYNGHPLYLYFLDQKPGDTNGQGVNAFGASWFAITPAGTQVSGPASSGTRTSSGGGGGY
jgi:predicted lipoprotein with Yx(FWY)xxD motif